MNINFIFTFSSLSIFLNILNFHNVLYFSNILSFLGFSFLLLINPYFFYEKYNWLLNTNLFLFNLICLIVHVMPIYFYRKKQNINKKNINETLLGTLLFLTLYISVFRCMLNELYPLEEFQLVLMVLILLSIMYNYVKFVDK